MSEHTFRLTIEHDVIARSGLGDWLKQRIQAVGATAYLVIQSIDKARICQLSSDDPLGAENFDSTFAGRVFGPNAELRWALHGTELDVWFIQEARSDDTTRSGPYYREEVCYYCLGLWKQKEGKYLEGHIPGDLDYPLVGNAEDDRFYLAVYEYLPAPTLGETDLNKLMNALNRPRVVATRFHGVGVGRTSQD